VDARFGLSLKLSVLVYTSILTALSKWNVRIYRYADKIENNLKESGRVPHS